MSFGMFRRIADPFQLFGTGEDDGRERIGRQLEGAMRGEGSMAELQRQQQQAQSLSSAFAQSQTGLGNGALQARQGQQMLGQMQGQANAQAAQMRLAEQERARQQYGAFLDAQGQREDATFGNLMSTAGSAAAFFSDVNTKEDATPVASDKFREFLSSVTPTEYSYKAEFGGEKRVGFMAQDIEHTDIGRTMIETGDDGLKRVKVDAAISALLATQAHLNERIEKVES